jgi:hypothetical protein
MGQAILIDTNIAIAYIGNCLGEEAMDKLDKIFDNEYHISVINKIELLGYSDLDKNEEQKFNLLIDNSIFHSIDNKIVVTTIAIRRKYKIKLPDALIAATCLVNELSIMALNQKDFANINGLNFIAP